MGWAFRKDRANYADGAGSDVAHSRNHGRISDKNPRSRHSFESNEHSNGSVSGH